MGTGVKWDNEIGLRHGNIWVCRASHANHMQALRIRLIKDTKAQQGCRYRDITVARELCQKLGTKRISENTMTSINKRSLRLVNELRRHANEFKLRRRTLR